MQRCQTSLQSFDGRQVLWISVEPVTKSIALDRIDLTVQAHQPFGCLLQRFHRR